MGERARRELTSHEPDESTPAPERTPVSAVLDLQRSAGNAAVAARLGRATTRPLARLTDKQTSDRAVGIWEEKGSPQGQNAEQQAADWAEGGRQAGAMERETTRRAEAEHAKRGGGDSTAQQAQDDWLKAEKSIVTDFRCERSDDWNNLIGRAALWTDGVADGAPKTDLGAIKSKLEALKNHLNTDDDLAARETLITEGENLIDNWIKNHGTGNEAKADQLLMLKMHTLAYERRRRLKMKDLQDKYGIKVNSASAIQAHKDAFTNPGNPATLAEIENIAGLSLFSLEELDMLDNVFAKYAPLLGPNRAAGLGAQPLDVFGRLKVGLEGGADPDVDLPVQSPGDFGVTIGSSITMYDKSNRDTLDFPTKPQQFRGTIEHELSHALIEPLIATGGGTMIQKFADDMDYWDGDIFTSQYAAGSKAATKAAAITAGSEVPPTSYGQTNAQEDLAETMMFFFEDFADLTARCPLRAQWVRDNLGSVLGQDYMKSLPAAGGGAPALVGSPP